MPPAALPAPAPGRNLALGAAALPEAWLPYAVKCDGCLVEMRRTASLPESAAGGLCPDCRKAVA